MVGDWLDVVILNQQYGTATPPKTPPKPPFDRIHVTDQLRSLSMDGLYDYATWLAEELGSEIVSWIQAGKVECGHSLTFGMFPAYRDLDPRVDALWEMEEPDVFEEFTTGLETTIYDRTMWSIVGDDGDGTVTHLICPGATKESCVNPENGWFETFND